MWDLLGPGLKPMSPALAGGFLTTEPQGKYPPFTLQLTAVYFPPPSLHWCCFGTSCLLTGKSNETISFLFLLSFSVIWQLWLVLSQTYLSLFSMKVLSAGSLLTPLLTRVPSVWEEVDRKRIEKSNWWLEPITCHGSVEIIQYSPSFTIPRIGSRESVREGWGRVED